MTICQCPTAYTSFMMSVQEITSPMPILPKHSPSNEMSYPDGGISVTENGPGRMSKCTPVPLPGVSALGAPKACTNVETSEDTNVPGVFGLSLITLVITISPDATSWNVSVHALSSPSATVTTPSASQSPEKAPT